VLAIGIFSAFILYDLKRVQDGQETNYITATLGVYLSLYNVFQSPAGAAGHLRRLRLRGQPLVSHHPHLGHYRRRRRGGARAGTGGAGADRQRQRCRGGV
jgi:hypothetical protein